MKITHNFFNLIPFHCNIRIQYVQLVITIISYNKLATAIKFCEIKFIFYAYLSHIFVYLSVTLTLLANRGHAHV